MWEMDKEVECPHCGHEQYETLAFDMDSMDRHGGSGQLHEVECYECYKPFWFRGYLDIEVSDVTTWKSDPNKKKGKS